MKQNVKEIALVNRGETKVRINYIAQFGQTVSDDITGPHIVFAPGEKKSFEVTAEFNKYVLPKLISHPSLHTDTPDSPKPAAATEPMVEVAPEVPSEVTEDPEADSSVDMGDIGSMSKSELQDVALRLGLDTTGLKNELFDRISDHLSN